MRRFLVLTVLLAGGAFSACAGAFLVVPFYNTSASPNLDWIGESISETIREALVAHGLPILTREEREETARLLAIDPAARPTKASAMKLGVELGADQLIYGEFEWTPEDGSSSPSKGVMRIRAHVIDLRRITREPDLAEEGAISELAQMQSRLAWRMLRYTRPEESPSQEEFARTHPPVRIDAMENYARGLLAPTLEQKHTFFTQAARLAPEFSPPCYQLGRMHWEENSYRAAAQWLERVSANDAHYLEANFLLGLCRYYSGGYAGALAAFELVARTAPLSEVYNNLGAAQFRQRVPGALDNLHRALDGNLTDADYHFNVGYVLWRQGDLAAAQQRFHDALEIDPEDVDARQMLERCLNQGGPRRGDLSTEGMERLKEDYEKIACWQLRQDREEGTRQ